MGSLLKPRCARGGNCYQVLKLRAEKPPTVRQEGELCDKCQSAHAGGYGSQGNAQWVDEVTQTIEAVLAELYGADALRKATLWDLFNLDPHNGGSGQTSDRGKVLRRLSTKMLTKLRDWLEANEEEALGRGYKRNQIRGLWTHISLLASLRSLPVSPDASLRPDKHDPTLPIEAVAYTRGGRVIDLTTIIRLERLRRKPGFVSERDLEKELGIPRSTIRRIIERMEEIGFSLDKFTLEELGYVATGRKRGRLQTQI